MAKSYPPLDFLFKSIAPGDGVPGGHVQIPENRIAAVVVDAAVEVHRELGPGLLESVYEAALLYVLQRRGLSVFRQVAIPISFQGVELFEGFRADLIVEEILIVEVKSVSSLMDLHRRQVQTYLKLSNRRLGLLINFNVPLVRDGIKRVANGIPEEPV